MDHTQDAAPEPAITQRMQQDIDLVRHPIQKHFPTLLTLLLSAHLASA